MVSTPMPCPSLPGGGFGIPHPGGVANGCDGCNGCCFAGSTLEANEIEILDCDVWACCTLSMVKTGWDMHLYILYLIILEIIGKYVFNNVVGAVIFSYHWPIACRIPQACRKQSIRRMQCEVIKFRCMFSFSQKYLTYVCPWCGVVRLQL